MEQVFPTQLDFKKYEMNAPKYIYANGINQDSGGNTVSATTTGGAESIFTIPTSVVNLSRSYISFTVTAPASAVGKIAWFFTNVASFWRQVQVYPDGGPYLCDLNYADNYTNIVWPQSSKMEEFLNYELYTTQDTAAEGLTKSGPGRILRPSNTLASDNYRHDGATGATSNYTEMQYFANRQNAATITSFMVRLPLSAFKNTILELDKDLYFGRNLKLRFVWNAGTKIAFTSTDASNPTTGTAALAVDIAITNLQLYLAKESNVTISKQIIDIFNKEGMEVLTPYVWGSKLNVGTSESQTINARFSQPHGLRLKKIIYSAYNNTETSSTSYDHTNGSADLVTSGAKISSFYTTLDGNRLQDFNVNCAQFEDWLLMQNKLRGSLIQNARVYNYNWFWEDDFSFEASQVKDPSLDQNNIVSGLDLSQERAWSIIETTQNAAYNHYVFGITERLIKLHKDGIVIV